MLLSHLDVYDIAPAHFDDTTVERQLSPSVDKGPHLLATVVILVADVATGLDAEEMADAGFRSMIVLSRTSELEERLYANEGIEIIHARGGDILDFEGGMPLADDGQKVMVTCPRCGARFTILL